MAQYLRLQNLPPEADNEDIRRFFHNFEIPEAGVHIIGGKDEEAFIAFHGENELLKALYSLDRQQLLGKEVKLLLGYESDMETIVRNRIKEIEEAGTPVSCADIEPKQEDTPPWVKRGKRTDSPTPQKRESNSTEIEPPWSKRPRYTSSDNPLHKKAKYLSSKSRNSVRKTHSVDDKKTNVPSKPLWQESSGHKQVKEEPSNGTSSKATTVTKSEVGNPETSVAITKDRNCPIKKEKIEEAPDTNDDVQENSKMEPKTQQREEQRYSRVHLEERKTWKEMRGIEGRSNDRVQSDREFFSDYLHWFPFSGGKKHFYLRVFDLHTDVTASEVWSWFDGAYGVVFVRSPRGTPRPSQAIVVFKDFATGRSAMDSLLETKVRSSGWHPQKVLTYLSRLTPHFQISVTTNSGTDHVLSGKQRNHFLSKGFSVGPQTLPAFIATKSRRHLVQTSHATSVVKAVKQQTLSAKNPKRMAGAQKFKMTPKKKQNKLPQTDKPKY